MSHPIYLILLGSLWLAWSVFWLIAALGGKAAQRKESLGSRALYLAPMLIAVALMLSHRLPFPWLYARWVPAAAVVEGVGIAIVAVGLGFSVWARLHLGGNWSGQITLKQDHELVRSGPYGVVRHPIYCGLLTALLGTALVLGEWRALLALACVLLGIWRKVTVEERWLGEIFPDAYGRYRREVPALVPFLRL